MWLRKSEQIVQFLLASISIAFTVIIGVASLWVPNGEWGTCFDMIVTVLAGIAATATGTITLSSVASPFAAKLPGRS